MIFVVSFLFCFGGFGLFAPNLERWPFRGFFLLSWWK